MGTGGQPDGEADTKGGKNGGTDRNPNDGAPPQGDYPWVIVHHCRRR
jgi:hypothetical protein